MNTSNGMKKGELNVMSAGVGVGKSTFGETKTYPDGKSGFYTCQCICGAPFIGHKRDNLCPACADGEVMITPALIERIRVGDSLTDAELIIAVEFYQDLEMKLRVMGERFHHSWLDVKTTLDRLKGYQQARGEKRG